MQQPPEFRLSFEPLTPHVYAAIPAGLLLTSIELKVLSFFIRPMSAEMFAQAIGTHAQSASWLLRSWADWRLANCSISGTGNTATRR
jgi:hypothetical protein